MDSNASLRCCRQTARQASLRHCRGAQRGSGSESEAPSLHPGGVACRSTIGYSWSTIVRQLDIGRSTIGPWLVNGRCLPLSSQQQPSLYCTKLCYHVLISTHTPYLISTHGTPSLSWPPPHSTLPTERGLPLAYSPMDRQNNRDTESMCTTSSSFFVF